ncbi:phage tail protein [Bradyrhizobium sp.]|uniref:phage tail protein n=1 Tax=Bradyrhizobium sp. TaxID=376 RepID=UPI003C412D0F
MSIFNWSQTNANNGNADPSINWSPGMAPSAVSPSGRAMMAAVAKWRDDIAGAIVTTGTSTAYIVSSYSQFDSLAHLNGQVIAFAPHVTNGATVTLNVDGLGAKPLRTAPNLELQSGAIIQGAPYVAIYNNTDGAFYLQGNAGNTYGIPLGAGLDYWGATTPSSAFAFPAGQAISRTVYSSLYTLVGNAYGAGDGTTTFNLPDCRGRVSVPADNLGGSQAGRVNSVLGNALGSAGGEQLHTLSSAEMPSHNHGVNDPGHSHQQEAAAPGTGNNYQTWASAGSGATAATATWPNTANAGTGISIQNAGGGGAHNNVQPSIVCNYIMRII